ncbi:glycosyltransferase family 2 protein [Microbacterium sp. 18062]|uniref:glycosyltransferase family 2 protein n=1 Tax=Microbacterium sp. 18062 TaxID=2681410 RepID=UPI001357F7D1|nr:glycosyltransferase family 2 protein [Microbacterium sp. 18062]
MSSRALVTVIVPGFDVAPWAGDALASLRRQTLAEWTAVLVDDASADGTGALFEAAAADDDRFRVLRHARRGGLGAARNAALATVETPFVAFLDADDVLQPGALARMVGVLDETGSDFVAGAYVRLRPDGAGGYAPGAVQPWVAAATSPERRGVTIEEHPEAAANIVAWSKVSRTAFWEHSGLRFPEGRLYEDQVVAQLMFARARRFDVVPDVVAHWRERSDGSSITQHEERLDVLRDCLDAMAEGLRVLEGTDHPLAARARVGQLLRMDVPRLARIAASHPEDAYRRAVGAFARDLWDRADVARLPLSADALPADALPLLAAARLW